MIIDAHCHLADGKWISRGWWEGLAKVAVPVLKKMGMADATVDGIIEGVLPGVIFDPTGEKQLAAMDEAGIDMAVIFPIDYGVLLGEPEEGIESINRHFAGLQNRYPDRFITYATVDPRRPEAADLIKKALDEWGMKGVKFHQGSGFYPNDKETRALMKIIGDRKVPVVFHTGHILQPLYSKYCDPMWLDELCADFPDQVIIAAHMGHGFRNQLFHMGACKTNLWTDLSDNQRRAAHEYTAFREAVRGALDNFGPDRVMFGTDGPYLRTVMSDKDYVQLIKDLPANAPWGISFTEEEIQGILGGNAARLLGLG